MNRSYPPITVPAFGSPEFTRSSPSEDASSTTSSGPYMSRTSPSSSPSPSLRSDSTARSSSDVTMRDLHDLLNDVRNQIGALLDGQVLTNHMLDDLCGRMAEDCTDLNHRVRNIENMVQQLLDRPR